MGRISVFIIIFGVLCALGMFLIVNCNMFEDIAMKGDIQLLTVEYEWVQVAKLTHADGAWFGCSVDISGDYIIVGNEFENTFTGSAFIYRRNGSNWQLMGDKIVSGDPDMGDGFGHSVSIDGNYAIIGAYRDDEKDTNSGAAYIFYWDGSSWTQQQKLMTTDPDTLDDGDQFGIAVSISGDKVIIGANKDNSDTGSAFVFHRSGLNWNAISKLEASTGSNSDFFGYSVSIDGNSAIIGAYQDDDNGGNSGSAYVFYWTGSIWGDGGSPSNENTHILASDGAAGDLFGYAVAISGSYALSGASVKSAVYFLQRNGTSWSQNNYQPNDIGATDQFGAAVDISGNLVIIGAYDDDDKGNDSGSAYIYSRTTAGWREEAKLLGSDSAAGDNFGYAVAVDGDYAVVGAYQHNGGAGAVYVFERKLVKK
jgi:hypothetical protein